MDDKVVEQLRGEASTPGTEPTSTSNGGERQIQIHPLVIMNIADHYTREMRNFEYEEKAISDDKMPQVIGSMFGIQNGLQVSVYDSFEIKYDVINGEVQIDKEFVTGRIQQCKSQTFLLFRDMSR